MNRYTSYGGFWRRFFAAIIDQLILNFFYALLLILSLLGGYLGLLSFPTDHDLESLMKSGGVFIIAYHISCMLINMCYYVYFHGTTGQTPGKKALGLRVVPISGGDMSFGIAFLRWVGYLISSIFFMLGYIWIAFDKRKQGWHDKIAGTVVTRVTG
ncbi:MAG: RDD family protein [Syntrophales bacterium]|nr:RDD family protein [Syntrophales bacterium]